MVELSRETVEAWQDLVGELTCHYGSSDMQRKAKRFDDAVEADLARAEQPRKVGSFMLVDNDWLREQIVSDPDDMACEAGRSAAAPPAQPDAIRAAFEAGYENAVAMWVDKIVAIHARQKIADLSAEYLASLPAAQPVGGGWREVDERESLRCLIVRPDDQRVVTIVDGVWYAFDLPSLPTSDQPGQEGA